MCLKMLSAEVICCIYLQTLLNNVSKEANSVNQDQTDLSSLDLHCLTKMLLKYFRDIFCCDWLIKD